MTDTEPQEEEIIQDSESEYETESDIGEDEEEFEIGEEGSQMFEGIDDEPFEGEMMDIGGLLGSLFSTEDGDTVATALVNISKQLETQNRIMVKILSQLQKSA